MNNNNLLRTIKPKFIPQLHIPLMILRYLFLSIVLVSFGFVIFFLIFRPTNMSISDKISENLFSIKSLIIILIIEILFTILNTVKLIRTEYYFYEDRIEFKKGSFSSYSYKKPTYYKDILRTSVISWPYLKKYKISDLRMVVADSKDSFIKEGLEQIENAKELRDFIESKRKQFKASSDGVSEFDLYRK
jgi:hypothetical protein